MRNRTYRTLTILLFSIVLIFLISSLSLSTAFAEDPTPTPEVAQTETIQVPAQSSTPGSSQTQDVTETPMFSTPTNIPEDLFTKTPDPGETQDLQIQSLETTGSSWICEDGYCEKTFSLSQGSDDAGPDWLLCENRIDWNEIYFGECDDTSGIISGFRFESIDLPKEAVVVEAYLEFTTDGTYTDPLNINIYAEDSPNPETYTYYSYPGYRPWIVDLDDDGFEHEVAISWQITEPWYFFGQVETPNVSWLVNRMKAQEGWVSGNSMSFILRDIGVEGAKHRRVFAFERAGAEYAAHLKIKYTVPPEYTTSRYWSRLTPDTSTFDNVALYQYGCQASRTSDASFITTLLDFGFPVVLSNGDAGLISRYEVKVKVLPVTHVLPAVQAYIQGFFYCSTYKPYYQHLTIVVGHNNTGYLFDGDNLANASLMGTAWGQIIAELNDWLDFNPCITYQVQLPSCSFRDRVTVFGGMDIEPWRHVLTGKIAPPESVNAWLEAYGGVSGDLPFINYGTCENCGVAGPNAPGQWDRDEILFFSWLFPGAFPMPEIYSPPRPGFPASTHASQWRELSEYSKSLGYGRILFWGSLTTCEFERYGECKSPYILHPDSSWSQLFWELYQNEQVTLRPSQLKYSSDISFDNLIATPEFD